MAEVFVGLVEGDSESYLRVDGNAWKPTLPGKVKGKFTMADLLQSWATSVRSTAWPPEHAAALRYAGWGRRVTGAADRTKHARLPC